MTADIIKPTGQVAIDLGTQRTQLPTGKVVFNNRIEIDLGQKIPHLCNGYSQAFLSRDTQDDKGMIAFIADPAYPPRLKKAQAYTQALSVSLPILQAAGTIELPNKMGQRLAFFYENCFGKPIYTPQPDFPLAFGWRSERVMERVVIPIIHALRDLQNNDLVHGAIRLDNIFDGGREKNAPVVLGECLSSPASIAQPLLYEPILRAMAMPSGRGEGLIQDDLYALGALTAILLRTKDPLNRGKRGSVEITDIISHKLQNGSYATLVSPDDHSVGGSLVELMRGTLVDDDRQRWTIDDALAWIEGKRLSPKQSTKKKKAPRPVVFNGKNIFYPEFLAREIMQYPQEAATAADTSDLFQWIERSLGDEEMASRYERAFKSAQDSGRGPGYPERLAARLSIAINPYAPIQYKNISITPEGIGSALAEAFILNRDLSVFNDIFNSHLIAFYLTIQTELNYDVANYVARNDACRNYIKTNTIGFGMERVLYHLNENVHCLSPLVSKYFVRTPEDFLVALENLLGTDKQPKTILDRHSVAFLAAKEYKLIEPYLFDITSSIPFRQVLGSLQCLAAIQRYYKTPPMRNVAKWLLPQLDLVIERYHDRTLREQLKDRAKKAVETGELVRLHQTIDSNDMRQRDLYAFRHAIGEYRTLESERYQHLENLQVPNRYKIRYGRETAVVVAGICATLITLGFIILHISGGGVL